MKNNQIIAIHLIVLASLLAACGGQPATAGNPTSGATPASATQPPAPTVAPTAIPATATPAAPALGDEVRAPQGGFAFHAVPGYTVSNEGDFISMEAADAQPNVGPGFVMLGGPNVNNVQTADAFAAYTAQLDEVTILDQDTLQVQGYNGHVHNFTAQSNGQPVRGRFIALASPDQKELFVLFVLAPPAGWDALEPYAIAVTNSLSFFEPEAPTADVLHQWATYTQGSSTLSVTGNSGDWWTQEQALGEPNNTDCTVTSQAWSPNIVTGQEEWLIVYFDRPVTASTLNIYTAAGPVPLSRVEVYDADNNAQEVYSSDAAVAVEGCPGLVTVPISVDTKVVSARLYFDAALSNATAAIDAVELVGTVAPRAALPAGMIEQWASQATASAEYHPATDAVGEQDAWLCQSDKAWTSDYDDHTVQWLEVTFDTPVVPNELDIYQSYNAGQISKVEVLDVDGAYHEVYAGEPSQSPNCPDVFVLGFGEDFTFTITGAKITVDQSQNGQTYIDAVSLVGTP